MTSFKASVQYDDWIGTSASDDADVISLRELLDNKKLIQPDEFPIATSLWVGENHAGKLGSIHVTAYLYDAGKMDFDTVKASLIATADPVPVRAVDIELSLEEFVVLFKRFNVMLTRKGLELEGRNFISR